MLSLIVTAKGKFKWAPSMLWWKHSICRVTSASCYSEEKWLFPKNVLRRSESSLRLMWYIKRESKMGVSRQGLRLVWKQEGRRQISGKLKLNPLTPMGKVDQSLHSVWWADERRAKKNAWHNHCPYWIQNAPYLFATIICQLSIMVSEIGLDMFWKLFRSASDFTLLKAAMY